MYPDGIYYGFTREAYHLPLQSHTQYARVLQKYVTHSFRMLAEKEFHKFL